jgi:FkbM family methyltransferase
MINSRKLLRDVLIEALAIFPFTATLMRARILNHCILWALFQLERDEITVARAGPGFCRYRMWLNWQDGTPYTLGTYEPPVANALRRHIRPGYCCFDIGAHIGYYAILMSRLTGDEGLVAAFEPLPESFDMLQKNVTLNALENVRLEPAALGERTDRLVLTFATHEKLTMTPSVTGYRVEGQGGRIEVAAHSLDGYVADLGRIPQFMLIDVEAAELAVLRGAESTLRRAHPKLLIEIHGWGTPDSGEVGRYLSQFGYHEEVLGVRGNEAFVFFEVE